MLSLTTLALAQTKAEFGFVVKAGTFAIPRQNLERQNFELKSSSELDFKMGRNFGFGIWYAWPLSERLRLSSELLYRSISLKSEDRINNDFWFQNQPNYTAYQRVHESSITLPIKFFYTLREGGKTSVSLGGGLSQIFASKINTQFEYLLLAAPNSQNDYAYMGTRYYPLQYQLNAGFHWMLDNKTNVGFEYIFEPLSKFYYDETEANSIVNRFFKDCFCHHSAPYLRTRMNSFSVSLRHNILD
jgi:hypothetical protein